MRIDTSTIEGYADMSLEDRLAALESFEYSDNAEELTRLKNAVSNANHEAAETKKALKALQDKASKGTSESEQKIVDLEAQVAALTKANTISKYRANYIAQGYDEELASSTATALAEGDTETVFANQKIFLENHDKALKAEALAGTPKPGGPVGTGSANKMTKDKFKALTTQEQIKYKNEHPNWRKELG